MNGNQKNVCIAVIVVIAAMLLFPPFNFAFGHGRPSHNLGYAFIFNPPVFNSTHGSIDIGMLLAQWLGVLIIGAIGYLIFKNKE